MRCKTARRSQSPVPPPARTGFTLARPGWAGCLSIAALLGGISTVHAENSAFSDATLDFELAANERFIRLSDLPPQVSVVNFWRSDCPPCVRELPALLRSAEAHAGRARVVAVALQRPAETERAPAPARAALRSPLLLLHGPSEPRGLLARFGNRSGALPYTLVLTPDRRPCARHSGEIGEQWLHQAIARCQTA